MNDKYSLALRLLHWTMAVLILMMLFAGVAMVTTAGPAYIHLVALHRPIGVAIMLLAMLRLAIRLRSGAPPLPSNLSPLQGALAKASHALLYAAMLGMPLIGWAMLSAGGYPVEMFPGFVLPPLLPVNGASYALLRQSHGLLAVLFFVLILGHLTMALIHGFVRRDGVLASIGFGRRPVAEVTAAEE